MGDNFFNLIWKIAENKKSLLVVVIEIIYKYFVNITMPIMDLKSKFTFFFKRQEPFMFTSCYHIVIKLSV